MTAQKKLATVESHLPVTPSDLDAEMAADAGAGFEEATKESFAIPLLVCLQDLSPQTKSKMAGYIEGAKPGMILNTISQELMTKARVIPCYFNQVYMEWLPREKKGGGLVAIHAAETPLAKQTKRDDRGQNVLPNGNILNDTRQHFVLLLKDDGSLEGCLIPMTSTQIKYSKRWMSLQQTPVLVAGRWITPPSFAYSYQVTTQEEANEQGSWYSWKITDRERVTDSLIYSRAKGFHSQMKMSGGEQPNVNYDEMAGAPADTPEDLDNDLDA